MADQGLNEKRQNEVEQLGEELNEELRAAGISSAEQSFGLGCGLGLVPVSLLVLVLYFFNVVDLIPALVLLLLALLVLVGVASYMASQARIHRMDLYYQECVEPQIEEYLEKSKITRSQFNAYLYTCLTDGAPLRDYLASKNPNEAQVSEAMLEKKEPI